MGSRGCGESEIKILEIKQVGKKPDEVVKNEGDAPSRKSDPDRDYCEKADPRFSDLLLSISTLSIIGQ